MPIRPASLATVRSTIRFHQTLNPRVWQDDQLRPAVRLHLLRAAMEFYKFLDVDGLKVEDVVLTGSNAAFNYTPDSDLDVHLVVDFADLACQGLAENLFTTKKALWADTYDVTVKGHAVELYVEDAANPARSNGLYSLLKGEWLRHPRPVAPERHDAAVARKTEALAAEIEALDGEDADADKVDRLMDRLRTMRRSGLADGGEYSTENLTYKALRALGYLDHLFDRKSRAISRELSLEQQQ